MATKKLGILERRGLLETFERWVEDKHNQARGSVYDEAERHVRGLRNRKTRLEKADELAQRLKGLMNQLYDKGITLKIQHPNRYGDTEIGHFVPKKVEVSHVDLTREEKERKEVFISERLSAFPNYSTQLEHFRNQVWLIDDQEALMKLLPDEFMPDLAYGE
jgi:hypothetical protein